MRFDGSLGFPGGLVDNPVEGLEEDEYHRELVEAIRRELTEELGMAEGLLNRLTRKNYIATQEGVRRNGRPLHMHLYGLEVIKVGEKTYDPECEIEK
jgi:8-oxo-dGTP pyrophosphatase MutT (NUDIX family)